MSEALRARCWDKSWQYVPKDSTDIRALFDRIREEQRQQAEKASTVRTLRKKEQK